MSEIMAERDTALLNFHLEPDEPLEISELTNALGSIARQYQVFAAQEGVTGKLAEGKLLISNVKPGSIDINLLLDFVAIAISSPPMVPMLFDKYELLVKFPERLRSILNVFLGKDHDGRPITVSECDDAVNIT